MLQKPKKKEDKSEFVNLMGRAKVYPKGIILTGYRGEKGKDREFFDIWIPERYLAVDYYEKTVLLKFKDVISCDHTIDKRE